MLMNHPPRNPRHMDPGDSYIGHDRTVNEGAFGKTSDKRYIPNHANVADYHLYQGPQHYTPYSGPTPLTGTFQHVIANWLKSGKDFLRQGNG